MHMSFTSTLKYLHIAKECIYEIKVKSPHINKAADI